MPRVDTIRAALQNPGQKTRAAVASAFATAALAAAIPGVAVAGGVAPGSAGTDNADAAVSNYWLILLLGLLGLVAVSAVIVRSLRATSATEVGDVPGKGLQRNAIAGAALATILIAAFALVTYDDAYTPAESSEGAFQAVAEKSKSQFGVLYAQPRDRNAPDGPSITVDVNGQRYLWRYVYHNIPDQSPATPLVSYHDLIVPEDTTILLNITSSDVTHSWWVPELGGKFDAIPNYVNKTWFKVDKPGVYEGACAEICGANHSEMTNRVRVLPVDEFAAWVEGQKEALAEDRKELAESINAAQQSELPAGLKSAGGEE